MEALVGRGKKQNLAAPWCQQAGVLSKDQAKFLTSRAEEKPSEAARVFTQALDLREAIYRIFYTLIQGAKPAANDLSLLNAVLARTLDRLRITGGEDGYDWTWSNSELPLDYPLGPLAYSAANLLVEGPELEHARQCRGDNCGWLFIDSSKNHSRCWCDMRDCGNRAKARRHRQKRGEG